MAIESGHQQPPSHGRVTEYFQEDRAQGRSSQRQRQEDRRLEAEGRGDQTKGNLKQAGAKVKDAFKH